MNAKMHYYFESTDFRALFNIPKIPSQFILNFTITLMSKTIEKYNEVIQHVLNTNTDGYFIWYTLQCTIWFIINIIRKLFQLD